MKYPIPISVVMPCYNNGKYVSEAINSILQQSFQHFEFIIINDGSTDDSHCKIGSFSDDRIHYICLRRNKGNYSARNIGMKTAKGKYIGVMDADDIAFPERLAIQYNYLEKHRNTAAIGSCGELIDEEGKLINPKLIRPAVSWAQLKTFLLMDNFVLHPSLMFRATLIKNQHLFYNEQYTYSSDFDFITRCASLFSLRNTNDILIQYRLHEKQISRNHSEKQVEFADQIRISQLKKFNLALTKYELSVYLLLMKRMSLETFHQLKTGEQVLNKILDRNRVLKLYDQKYIYQLFDYILFLAQEKLVLKKSIANFPAYDITNE